MKQVVILFIFFYSTAIFAQEPIANEELKSLIKEGFNYFPRMKEVEQMKRTSELKIDLNNTYRMPTVVGNASYNYVNPVSKALFPAGPNEVRAIQFNPYNNVNAYVGINYTLLDFGRIKANVEKAKIELQESSHNVDLLESQLAAQITNLYYSILYLRKAIAVQDSVLDFMNENYRVTESKFRNGDALKIDLLNIQASIDSEKNRKLDIQKLLQKDLNLLSYTTGKDTIKGGDQFDFVYDNLNEEDLLRKTSENNPDFLLAHDKIKVAETDVLISKTQNRPTFNLLANAGFRNGYFPNIYQVRFNYLVGGALTVPIYAGGRYHQQTVISRSLVEQNRLALNSLENTYRKDIEQMLDDILAIREQLNHVEGQIAQAREAQLMTASRYKNGTATYLDLINSNAAYQRAHLGKLQYELQLVQSYSELARLSGVKYW